ncbi:MAG: hypothetical protein AAGE59_09930 [Cyanobacteria bacterium P01_F01_bin.86]
MRNLCPYFWIFLHDRTHSNIWIQFLGLSFGLMLGSNILAEPTQATTAEPRPDFSELAVTPRKIQKPTIAASNFLFSTTEGSPDQAQEALISVLLESIEPDVSWAQSQRITLSAAPTAKTVPIKEANFADGLGLATTLGLRGDHLKANTPMVIRPETSQIAIASTLRPLPQEDTAAINTIAREIELVELTHADTPSVDAIEFTATEIVSQAVEATEPTESAATDDLSQVVESSEPLDNYQPLLEFQAVSIYQNDDFSGRLRATGIYAVSEQVLFGAVVDLTTGDAFVDSDEEGLNLNELYVAAAPIRELPNLRFVGGLIDFTAYFDRNSFAKDAATHFFNPVFQTNPALSAAGIASRPGLLVNWSATDNLELKAAAFSSTRDLGDFAIDGFAAELGFRVENFILRGTFATARDAGEDDGFAEIFQFQRDDDSFGLLDDDREVAYGINAEYFFESINLGIFGRYGWYENQDLDSDGETFSLGLTALDVFLDGDRLGLAYGQRLSNSDLRSGKTPDVWELLYDAPIFDGVRAGVSLQSQDEFSDTFLGLRLRADW